MTAQPAKNKTWDNVYAGVLSIIGGGMTALTGLAQFPPSQVSLQHSLRGDVLDLVEQTNRWGDRSLEFRMKNGEVWTYVSYLPHYESVAALSAGPLDQIELGAEGEAGRDDFRDRDIRWIREIRAGDELVVRYQEVAGAEFENAKALVCFGGAMIVLGLAFIGWAVLQVRRRGRNG